MPPSIKNKRKAKQNLNQPDSNGKRIKPHDCCEVPFNGNPTTRGHPKEYGDATVFPCGKHSFQDDHYNTFKQCQVVRLILDAWELANFKEHPDATVPHLSHAGVMEILNMMGVSPEYILTQRIGWTPYMPITWKSLADGRTRESLSTFVDTYKKLPVEDKIKFTCPPIPMAITAAAAQSTSTCMLNYDGKKKDDGKKIK